LIDQTPAKVSDAIYLHIPC